ncbi:hypothetical protein [Myxosarcina sp. GI1(2024)]
MFHTNITHWLRTVAIAFILIVGTWLLNVPYSATALAGDNYSAETDTYQQTRNPNRVDSNKEELANSKTYLPEETEGKSIYENVIDRVNQQRETYSQDQTPSETERQ